MSNQLHKIEFVLGIKFEARAEKPHWSNYSRQDLEQVGLSLQKILLDSKCWDLLNKLDRHHFFEIFMPELEALKNVPQHKQNSKDAFHHSLSVVVNTPGDPILKWAALLHDIGKAHYKVNADGTLWFRNHEYQGAQDAKNVVKRMKIGDSGDICHLIRYHSHPLDYQRQPNWKIVTVQKFCDKHGHLSLPLIDLAIADKISSSSQSEYLDPLYYLKNMVWEISHKEEVHETE